VWFVVFVGSHGVGNVPEKCDRETSVLVIRNCRVVGFGGLWWIGFAWNVAALSELLVSFGVSFCCKTLLRIYEDKFSPEGMGTFISLPLKFGRALI
jgi:hypothetical protein